MTAFPSRRYGRRKETKLTTVEELAFSGDYLDVYALRSLGLFEGAWCTRRVRGDDWPDVAAFHEAKYRLTIEWRAEHRKPPQTIEITWVRCRTRW
jgi:hypothetical protein